MTSIFSTRDRAIDLARPGNVAALDKATAKLYTAATEMLPTDGIVWKTAMEITHGANSDPEKATPIYEWIVDNTQRNPKTKGCGTGDIRGMLETGNLSGKCADLNALYVGLARAAGLPARDVYGIRVADSRFGYKSLGKSGEITKAQHCRAEFWLPATAGCRWIRPTCARSCWKKGRAGGQGRCRGRGAPAPVRLLGDELARLQFRARPRAAGLEGPRRCPSSCIHRVRMPVVASIARADRFRYKITSREITA